jgi:hypothetical protein
MDHRDVEMSDVIIVFDDIAAGKIDEVVLQLKHLSLFVESIDYDNGVVEGTIESAKITILETVPAVKYVRGVLTYVADYPAGDPRNLDEDDRADEHIPR